jgi:hypothetical protein
MNTLKNQKLMDACVKRANEIINERMNAWQVDESNIGTTEMQELADAAWKIAYNECKIGLLK